MPGRARTKARAVSHMCEQLGMVGNRLLEASPHWIDEPVGERFALARTWREARAAVALAGLRLDQLAKSLGDRAGLPTEAVESQSFERFFVSVERLVDVEVLGDLNLDDPPAPDWVAEPDPSTEDVELELLKAGFVFDEATGRFFQFEPGELEAMLGETEAEPLAVAN
jgi:hypothetical protein